MSAGMSCRWVDIWDRHACIIPTQISAQPRTMIPARLPVMKSATALCWLDRQ